MKVYNFKVLVPSVCIVSFTVTCTNLACKVNILTAI